MRDTKPLTKQEVIELANSNRYGYGIKGNDLIDPDYQRYADLDGTEARRYLESRGFTVVRNYDTGHNGVAITECGIHLSTNGFISQH